MIKFCASKASFVVGIISLCMTVAIAAVMAVSAGHIIKSGNDIILCVLAVAIYSVVLIFLFVIGIVSINRDACIITYDKEKQEISRRGRIWGYKSVVKMSDVREIKIICVIKCGKYFVIIDGEKKSLIPRRKDSYIMFPVTPKTSRFVESIWDKYVYTHENYVSPI